MMTLRWLKNRKDRKDAAAAMYATVVERARSPVFYAQYGVADTIDGRFDLIVLHVFLIVDALRGLGPEGQKLAQKLFDTMFVSIDLTLREMGIGDLGVPKHMKKMMKAFNGRLHSYHEALEVGSEAALQLALARNIFRAQGEAVPMGVAPMAAYIFETHEAFKAYALNDFLQGRIVFPPIVSNPRKEAVYA